MTAELYAIAGAIINLLLGGVIWFMKQSYTDVKEQVKANREQIDNIKEHYIKKEDFREFKDELFVKLDKMDVAWTKKLDLVMELRRRDELRE